MIVRCHNHKLCRADVILYSLATLNRRSADDQVLAAFQEIMPDTVTLYGVQAMAD